MRPRRLLSLILLAGLAPLASPGDLRAEGIITPWFGTSSVSFGAATDRRSKPTFGAYIPECQRAIKARYFFGFGRRGAPPVRTAFRSAFGPASRNTGKSS